MLASQKNKWVNHPEEQRDGNDDQESQAHWEISKLLLEQEKYRGKHLCDLFCDNVWFFQWEATYNGRIEVKKEFATK